jgi:hypothetical protein
MRESDSAPGSPISDQDLLVVPVREIDLGLSFPVPVPLYIGLAPEAAP